MKEKHRSLWECQNAIYPGKGKLYIYCSKGHKLGTGYVNPLMAIRGQRLVFKDCQGCPDFERNGEPIPQEERGWLSLHKLGY